MKKLIAEIAAIVAVFLVARWFVLFVVGARMMDHMGECHAELGVANRIHGPAGPERDALFRQYEQCTKDKGTFIDNFFIADSLHEAMEELRKQ